MLDGQGAYWWAAHNRLWPRETYTRAHLIEVMHSSAIEIADLTMKDLPFCNTHIYRAQ